MVNANTENVFPDYFGHETEALFLDWAVAEFRERANIHVKDKEEIVYLFEVTDGSTGCGCDTFDWAEVRVEIKYDDFVLIYTGFYSGDWDDRLELDTVSFVNMGNIYLKDMLRLRS